MSVHRSNHSVAVTTRRAWVIVTAYSQTRGPPTFSSAVGEGGTSGAARSNKSVFSGQCRRCTPRSCSGLSFVGVLGWRRSVTDGSLYPEVSPYGTTPTIPDITCTASFRPAPIFCYSGGCVPKFLLGRLPPVLSLSIPRRGFPPVHPGQS